MINPRLRAPDRIHTDLPEALQELMRQHILPEQEHLRILKDIKDESYNGKIPVKRPKFTIVCGQTGSGKSNLTASLYSQNPNMVIIDSDKYKAYRPDNEQIQQSYPEYYAYLTAPDSYLHRDEMLVDALSERYNILMECATSQKEGLFIDISSLIKLGYEVEICVLGVSSLNSLISVHERYEELLAKGNKAAKLTNIARHDDSFVSLSTAIRDTQNMQGVTVKVYERGKGPTYFPVQVYSSEDCERRFSCALEALILTQGKDEKETIPTAEQRLTKIEEKMKKRGAPGNQLEQLASIQARYEERVQELRGLN